METGIVNQQWIIMAFLAGMFFVLIVSAKIEDYKKSKAEKEAINGL